MTYPMKARIRNEGSGPARVDIFDDIGAGGWFSDGYTPASFAAAIKDVSGPLDIHINSGGGDVADGIAIKNAIAAYPGRKRTVVDGLAASIASVIAQAGDERIVEPGAMLMIHDPLTAVMGNAADMRKTADTLDKHGDNLAGIYAARAGGTPEQWRQTMQGEAWYTADEAVAAGLADRVGTAAASLPQGVDVEQLAAHAPGRIMAALRSMPRAAAEPEPYEGDDKCPTCKGKKTIRGGNMTCPDCKGSGKAPADAEDRGQGPQAAAGDPCKTCGGKKRLPHPGTGKNGITCPGCGGSGTYDPDTAPPDEPDDEPGAQDRLRAQAGRPYEPQPYKRSTDENVQCPACQKYGDDDARYCGQCATQLAGRTDVKEAGLPPATNSLAALDEAAFAALRPVFTQWFSGEMARLQGAAKVDESDWDGPAAMSAAAKADDPAAALSAVCAGRKAGPADQEGSYALPYKKTPSSPPNAAGVKNALARLSQTEGLTNEADAKKTLEAAMKTVNPDYEAPEDSSTKSVFSQRLEQMRAALPTLKGADV